MKILGLDCSSSSPGVTIEILNNDTLEIENIEFKGISLAKRNPIIHPAIKFFDEKEFVNYIDKFEQYSNWLLENIKDVEYAAIEDYSFGSIGRKTLLSEICGFYKYKLYKNGTKLRLYAPTSWKKSFTGYGSSDKISVYDSYIEKVENGFKDYLNIKSLPIPSTAKGIGPTSDILDSLGVCETLRLELKLRKEIILPKELEKHNQEVFKYKLNKKTKELILQKESYLIREFI